MPNLTSLTDLGAPLLQTKLFLPEPRGDRVSRPRLIERLDQVSDRKLIVISAPAGFGKSTLLTDWLGAMGDADRARAWLSLDPADNDPVTFWSYVIAALQRAVSGTGERARVLLLSPDPPAIEVVITTLLNEVSACRREIVLVLDDFHVIDDPAISDVFAVFVERLPSNLRVVIASRSEPVLPLSRLRARGECFELRAADLRFTESEAGTFLATTMGLALRSDEIAVLERRTEGWIAGLQLAAISLAGRADAAEFVEAFAGDNRYVLDYLGDEVLNRLPVELRSFLLNTAVLDRLSGGLCDALTGGSGGQAMLEALERGNLFLVPLDDKRRWFRYHHLFKEVLLAHLEAEQADHIPMLHVRAAAWYETNGMIAEAIDHAYPARDVEMVARLLVTHLRRLERSGLHASLKRWSAGLPASMVSARPRLGLTCASIALHTEPNLSPARALVNDARAAFAGLRPRGDETPVEDPGGTVIGAAGWDTLEGELLALELQTIRSMTLEARVTTAQEALALLPSDQHDQRAVVHLIAAGVLTALGEWDAARGHLRLGEANAKLAGNDAILANILSQRGEIDVAAGRLDDGKRAFEEALVVARANPVDADCTVCASHALLAEVLLEQNDLSDATRCVVQSVEAAKASPPRSYVLHAYLTAVEVFMATGDRHAALEHLEAAREFARGAVRFRFPSFLASVELKYFLQIGDLDAANDVARRRELTPDAIPDDDNEEELTAFARLLIARAEYGDAATLLKGVIAFLRQGDRQQKEVRALALLALANHGRGDRDAALDVLRRAIQIAEPGRFRRTFTAEGPAMDALLVALRDADLGSASASTTAYVNSLLADAPSRAPAVESPRPTNPINDLQGGRLTSREAEILGLIAGGLRNQEIADRLFISLPTVKRHIANAYAKLDVAHRTEAIAKMRTLNIL